eukprot:Ihof_evm1s527 gene=Ihof_evmTU1s527
MTDLRILTLRNLSSTRVSLQGFVSIIPKSFASKEKKEVSTEITPQQLFDKIVSCKDNDRPTLQQLVELIYASSKEEHILLIKDAIRKYRIDYEYTTLGHRLGFPIVDLFNRLDKDADIGPLAEMLSETRKFRVFFNRRTLPSVMQQMLDRGRPETVYDLFYTYQDQLLQPKPLPVTQSISSEETDYAPDKGAPEKIRVRTEDIDSRPFEILCKAGIQSESVWPKAYQAYNYCQTHDIRLPQQTHLSMISHAVQHEQLNIIIELLNKAKPDTIYMLITSYVPSLHTNLSTTYSLQSSPILRYAFFATKVVESLDTVTIRARALAKAGDLAIVLGFNIALQSPALYDSPKISLVFSSTLMRFISQKCTTDVMKRRVHTNQILNMIRIEPPPRRLISESIPKAPPLLPSNPVRSKTYRRAYTFLVAGMASIVGLLAMCIVEPHLHLRRERAARQARIATRVKERMACSLREDYATKDENVDREARVLTALALLPLVDTDHQRQALDYLCTVSASLGGVDEIERAGGVPILLDLAGSLCYSPHRMLLMQLLARLSALPSVPPCIIQSANDSTLTGLSAVKNIPLSVFKTEIATASHFAADDTQELSNRQRALEREDLRRLRMLQVSLIPGDRCMEHIVTQTKKRLSAARSVKRQEKEGRFQMGEDMFTAVTSASSSPDSMLHGTCLQSLALLSTVDENRKKIVDGGGLGILMDAHRFPPHDITEEEKLENRIEIARILANLALDGQVTGPIIRSGWLGVLKEWVGSGYMKLESEATRALANLDTMAIAARRKELEDVEHE